MMDSAELDKAVLEILDTTSVSEYELIKALQSEPYYVFNQHVFDDELSLFRTHFIVYNALYRLRDLGLAHQIYSIDILPTKITKSEYVGHANKNISAPNTLTTDEPETEKLRRYYLDWQNFEQTTESDLQQMLDDFWQTMGNRWRDNVTNKGKHRLDELLAIMQLQQLPNAPALKTQYRKLSVQYHPDKGGDVKHFQQIVLAYQELLPLCNT